MAFDIISLVVNRCNFISVFDFDHIYKSYVDQYNSYHAYKDTIFMFSRRNVY